MPNIIERILGFFKKPEKPILKEVVNLEKWENLKRLPDSFIGDIFHNCRNLDEIAMALIYSDKKTIGRFLWAADAFRKKEILEPLIKKHSDISKEISDKMKAHVANYSGIGKPGYFQTTLKD